ncbi:FG-GAP-like repeat-containing protein [Arenibacter sp. GZD96]|uniref:FG-GAP-like repeat-containing protein n=1 Tax=Aurantibrevibacter litoralis TaxID=3106030 RepID=UPI002AFED9D6|nr:FG-GAP-like repeat-containing protein [Arenibacter sp. GZD-96]MEA1785778.1 FG-GAP-like repeat-containing protein [Arenibacter sp. GZD-96]
MRTRLLLALAFMMAIIGHAQTNYDIIPLEGTPITVTERNEDAPQLGTLSPESVLMSTATSGAGGNAAITETAGELSVSLTGGATYNVPIKVPPGINGVVPTIAISYNSQGGNGLAGFGWNISGVSVISRIPATTYHDNNIDPVDFDNQDRFALDGQRLLLQLGTYGANGAVYGTENFSNVKIVSNGVSTFGAAYGPLSFTVTYPDGSIATYGNSTDSRSRTDYAITKWQNPQGVTVDYTYTTADNSLSIASIKYGHLNTGTAPNTISFVYKTRSRGEQSFVGGVDFRRKNLLSEIRVLTGATGYRNYVLGHNANSLGYERLASVTEKSGDNTLSFTPINFTYSDTSPTLTSAQLTTSLSVGNIEHRNAEVVPLDFNADGKMDFIVYPKTRSERNKLWIFEDLASGGASIGSEILNIPVFETAFPVSYLNSVDQLDKAQGFVLLTHTGSNEVRFKVNGQSSYAPAAQYYEKVWSAPSYSTQYDCSQLPSITRLSMRYASGDFNGDGLTDVIGITRGGYSYSSCTPYGPANTCICSSGTVAAHSTAYFINLDRRISTGFANIAGDLSAELKINDQLLTADVNGDGKTDFLHVSAGKVQAYTLTSTNGIQLLWTTTDTRIRTDYPILLGDYNGDGKTDFMTPTALNSGTFALFSSMGSGFVKNEIAYPFQFKPSTTATSPVTTYTLVPTDINGDGRTDMLEYKTVTNNDGLNGSQTVSMYYNTFSTLAAVTPAFSYITATTRTGNLNHFPIPVFLTSADRANNNLDFATISNNRVFYFTFGKDNREDMLLRNVSNNGVSQAISYRDLDRAPGVVGEDGIKVYTEKSGQVYPYIDIYNARGTKVVVAVNRAVSGTTTIKQVFSYEGAVSHADGLGFMGFQGLARSEWNTGNTDRIWNITKHSIPLRGAVTSEYTVPYTVNFNAIPSDYITQTAYAYGSSLAANKVFKLWNTSNVTQNRLQGGTAISKSFLYDAYNNPTRITTDFSGQGSSVVNITYANNGGAQYYFGRPTNKTETVTIGGNAFSTEEQYLYTGYLLTTKSTKGNGTQFDAETYLYDAFGNITRKTTTPYGTDG